MSESPENAGTLISILQSLRIPSEYKQYPVLEDNAIPATWKDQAEQNLLELKAIVTSAAKDGGLTWTRDKKAAVVAAAAQFDGDGPWISSTSRGAATDILDYFKGSVTELLTQILTEHVKPIFRTNPHPLLHTSTGRKLPRPAGGPLASSDYYESQSWKDHPGAPNLLSWCVRHIPNDYWDELWHLIIPPVMTLLDDYEAKYKVQGARIVSEMLRTVPRTVLKRTGIDGLLNTSLQTCLAHLQRPESATLIRETIPASVSLTTLTTDQGSQDRFDHLSALLGDGIIGGIWLYSSLDLAAVEASVEALPLVIDALGLGCTRFLKALIPQLVYPLSQNNTSSAIDFQFHSTRALGHVIDACAPRIHRWKGSIVDGVGRCWVATQDGGTTNSATVELLRSKLVDVCDKLAQACPSVIQEEYRLLYAVEPALFTDLVGGIIQRSSDAPSVEVPS
ncbi:TTI2 family protein [Pleurotus pulmonarius]